MKNKEKVCADYEMSIYLWKEIKEHEKGFVLMHLNSCPRCKKLFDDVQAMQKVTDLVAQQKKEIPNAARLTGQIMEKIHASKTKSIPSLKIGKVWANNLLRLTSLAFSVTILLAFGIEYFNVSGSNEHHSPSGTKTVILNAQLLKGKIINSSKSKSDKELCNAEFLA
ncbi:MAG: hypothetical protein OEU76_08830, partial [Cyclobacteriaceae bacterium]|nr:hypothetical protein [Cyclobacteriaceae bacterium]